MGGQDGDGTTREVPAALSLLLSPHWPKPDRWRSGYLGRVVEVERVVNASGLVGLAGRHVSVGQALAGHRVTLRLDGDRAHVIDDGVLVRTLAAPVPPSLPRRPVCARTTATEPEPEGPAPPYPGSPAGAALRPETWLVSDRAAHEERLPGSRRCER
jgi:hypothetical protein